MTLTNEQREILLVGLGIEIRDLTELDADKRKRRAQENVVAFLRGLVGPERLEVAA